MSSKAYVGQDSLELSRHFEKRLVEVSPKAGFLFVSVQAEPTLTGNCIKFLITLGIERKLEEEAAEIVVKKVFEKEIVNEWYGFAIRIVRGTRGSAANETVSGSPQASA